MAITTGWIRPAEPAALVGNSRARARLAKLTEELLAPNSFSLAVR
ncbi:hypothetical protein AB0N05_14095 [Nocardia sp. NPDC051030]